MKKSNSRSLNSPPLRVLDPGLPILANKAALELDDLLQRRKVSLDSVSKFAGRLRSSLRVDSNNGTRHSLDPTTLTLIGKAINQVPSTTRITNVDELMKRAGKVADVLTSRITTRSNRTQLEWALEFCVAFSRLVSDYHKSIYEIKPSHPHRRFESCGI